MPAKKQAVPHMKAPLFLASWNQKEKGLNTKYHPPQSMPNRVNIPIRLIIFGDDEIWYMLLFVFFFSRMGIKGKNRVGPKRYLFKVSNHQIGKRRVNRIPRTKCRRYFHRIQPNETYLITFNLIFLKPCQNKKGRKFVSAAPKMVSFFTAGSWETDTIFGAAKKTISALLILTGL